ncbi:protein SMG5 [Neodiprion fabricii]|uniref:protein SMG5 n=1 Tax=Neodiprion fabricii TaxID=2872261 RepID=UPI001ED8E6D7|nr:protein SMG5 [Neodiprion fabricii]
MKKSFNPVADARNDCLDQTRRLYRGVTDIAQRLDEQRSRSLSVIDIFTPSGETLRAKLRDYCERLIFKDTIGHARKIEELLWRRGFYDVVVAVKKLRKANSWNETEKAYIFTHLAVGVGFYHHLILRLQLECNLDLMGVIDFASPQNKEALSNRKQKSLQSKMHTEEVRRCAIRFIHRSLICLGDLSRYKLDLDPCWDPKIATRYYKMAILIDPNIGMPHNQLGTMSGNKNFGLDAVYYYMRCMLCSESFEGAEGNLKRMIATHSFTGKEEDQLHRCIAQLLSLLQLWNSISPNSDSINQVSQELLAEFENCLTLETTESDSKKEEESSIQLYLQSFAEDEPYHLTDEMMFKIMVICFMTIMKLQSKDSPEVRGVIAFTLAILSQLLQTTIERLQESVINISLLNSEEYVTSNPQFVRENGNDELKTDDVQETNGINIENKQSLLNCDNNFLDINDNRKHLDNIEETFIDVDDLLNGVKKSKDKSKSLLTKLRRPRRRKNSSDSDASDADGAMIGSSSDELNSDISETEEDALSEEIILSDDGVSEDLSDTEVPQVTNKEQDSIVEDKTNAIGEKNPTLTEIKESINTLNANISSNSVNETVLKDDRDSTTNSGSALTVITNVDSNSAYDESNGSSNTIAYVAQLKKQSLGTAEIMNVLMGEGILTSIKICFDWLIGNPDIVQSCAKSSSTLLKRISTLLNLININADALFKNPENITLFQNLNSQNLRKSVEVVPLPEDIELKGLKVFDNTQKTLNWEILKKFRMNKREETLLRIMKLIKFGHFLSTIEESGISYDETTRLFVTSHVDNSTASNIDSRKEKKESEADHPQGKLMRHMGRLWLKAEVRALETRLRSRLMSPYLVPDHEALSKHMPALKRLVYAKRFIVVIPSVVVSALDEVKRTSSRAREATRWLEAQLRRGSRFLRAQRPHERLPIPLVKGPRPKDKEAWLYFQIIECCHYLTNQTKVSLTSEGEAPVVTLLTGCSADEQKTANFSPVGLAKSAGVNLEHIESFHTKWKASSKSHG